MSISNFIYGGGFTPRVVKMGDDTLLCMYVVQVIAAHNAGKILSFVDPQMGSYNGDALEALFRLGMACCRDRTDDRPSMVDVVRELENIWRSSPYSMPLSSSVNFTYSPSTSDSAHYTGQDASSMTALDIEKSNVTELLSHTVAFVRPR
jgi:hypothetical protein